MLAFFIRMLLTCLLGDIIIRKPYKPRERKQRHYGYLPPLLCSAAHTDDKRQNSEADNIAERIELDAEALFLIRAILLCSCNYTVEHITEAGEHKAYDSGNYFALHGKAHTYNG